MNLFVADFLLSRVEIQENELMEAREMSEENLMLPDL